MHGKSGHVIEQRASLSTQQRLCAEPTASASAAAYSQQPAAAVESRLPTAAAPQISGTEDGGSKYVKRKGWLQGFLQRYIPGLQIPPRLPVTRGCALRLQGCSFVAVQAASHHCVSQIAMMATTTRAFFAGTPTGLRWRVRCEADGGDPEALLSHATWPSH